MLCHCYCCSWRLLSIYSYFEVGNMSSVTVAHSKMRMKNSLVFLMLLASMKKMFSNFWLTIRKTKEQSQFHILFTLGYKSSAPPYLQRCAFTPPESRRKRNLHSCYNEMKAFTHCSKILLNMLILRKSFFFFLKKKKNECFKVSN